MTAIAKAFRGQRPNKRLDLTEFRAALEDGKQWTALGVVVAPEDGGPHWEIVDGADIMVEVELQPTRDVVQARLAGGMWVVPDLGEEVAVVLPAGEISFMPTIVCILTASVPTGQAPSPNRIVIARSEIVAHDGAGGAVSLALKSDAQSIVDALTSTAVLAGLAAAPGDGGSSFKTALLAALVNWPTGTSVFKAK